MSDEKKDNVWNSVTSLCRKWVGGLLSHVSHKKGESPHSSYNHSNPLVDLNKVSFPTKVGHSHYNHEEVVRFRFPKSSDKLIHYSSMGADHKESHDGEVENRLPCLRKINEAPLFEGQELSVSYSHRCQPHSDKSQKIKL